MKPYVLALVVGLLVGVIYALLNVRSPAPPVVALVGLLGILAGEQAVPIVKRWLSKEPITAAWLGQNCKEHVFGQLPQASQVPRSASNDPTKGDKSADV
jgi:XapX domain-containing protein